MKLNRIIPILALAATFLLGTSHDSGMTHEQEVQAAQAMHQLTQQIVDNMLQYRESVNLSNRSEEFITNLQSSAPGTSVTIQGDLSPTYASPIPQLNAFVSMDNQATWDTTACAPLGTAGYGNTWECNASTPGGNDMAWYLQAKVNISGDTLIATQAPKNVNEVFPPGDNLLATLATDPAWDQYGTPFTDILDISGTYSNDSLYFRMQNGGGGYPLWGSYNTGPFWLYGIGLVNPLTFFQADTITIYALGYAYGIYGTLHTGLLKVQATSSGEIVQQFTIDWLQNEAYLLGNYSYYDASIGGFVDVQEILADVTGDYLSMAMPIAPLLADADFGAWPNSYGGLIAMGMIASVTNDTNQGATFHDAATPGILILETQFQTGNVAPALSSAAFDDVTNQLSVSYLDSDSNLPVAKGVTIGGREIGTMTPLAHTYGTGAGFVYDLVDTTPGNYTATFDFQDGAASNQLVLDFTIPTLNCNDTAACNFGALGDCVYPAGCNDWCSGDAGGPQVVDCAGVCGGTSVVDECGVCNGPGILPGECDCAGSVLDCLGVCGGTAVVDACGVCDGPGLNADGCCGTDVPDCAGVCGGTSALDVCGVCDGPGLNADGCCGNDVPDCAGVCGGTSVVDVCGVCDGPGLNADGCCGNDTPDCAGVCGGTSALDVCGVCDGPGLNADGCCGNDTPDCAGVCGGTSVIDDCSDCVLPANFDAAQDCAGVCNGTAYTDDCGVCDADPGNDNACYGCTNSGALNYDPSATIDDGSCTYPQDVTLYFGAVDEVNNTIEIWLNNPGPLATGGFQFGVDGATITGASGGTAQTYGFFVSVGGQVLGVQIGLPIPAGDELLTVLTYTPGGPINFCLSGAVVTSPAPPVSFGVNLGPCYIPGCTDNTACNYDLAATVDDGSCVAPQGCNDWCAGDPGASEQLDCAGVCGGTSALDVCSVCDGPGLNADGCCGNDVPDCAGVCGGTSALDVCGVCDGPGLNASGCCGNDVPDCAGVCGGTSTLDVCGVCDGPGLNADGCCGNDTPDCAGVCGGTSALDVCGVCDGPGLNADGCCGNDTPDCAGVCGGTSALDVCGVCDGPGLNADGCCGNDTPDCAGVCGGTSTLDVCGVCDGPGLNADGCCGNDTPDCAGVCGGTSVVDVCGVCDGPGLNADDCCGNDVPDCAGVCGGISALDVCGVCDGPGLNASGCCGNDVPDCAGVCGGTSAPDVCGVCDGPGLNASGCCGNDVPDCAGVCGGTSVVDVCGVCDGPGLNADGCCGNDTPDCTGVCGGTAVVDECGVCDGPGILPGECDCAGNVLDECGVCGGSGLNADGCCGIDIPDCNGDCGGTAVIDECGVCGGSGLNQWGCCGNEQPDCFGDCGGIAQFDACGICAGPGLNADGCCGNDVPDCFGVCGGMAVLDECGVCDGPGLNAAGCCGNDVPDCAGVCGGVLVIDECGICGGSGLNASGCCGNEVPDCFDVCGGTAALDECGVCDGPGILPGECDCAGNVLDCNGECGGTALTNECGCYGGSTGLVSDFCYGCLDPAAMNYDPVYTIEPGFPNPNDICAYQGDFNNDDQVNVTDVVEIVGFIQALGTPTDYQLLTCDINGDGLLNVVDLVTIIDTIVSPARTDYAQILNCNLLTDGRSVRVQSEGDVAGVQMRIHGEYAIEEASISEGWQLFDDNGQMILLSMTGAKLNGDLLFRYSGNLTVESNIVVDWYQNNFQAEMIDLPSEYVVAEAYPNPFNPSTTIEYSLPAAAHLTMSVYNILGTKVADLVNDEIPAGNYSVTWNADAYASGIYFVRLETAGYTHTQKIILIK